MEIMGVKMGGEGMETRLKAFFSMRDCDSDIRAFLGNHLFVAPGKL